MCCRYYYNISMARDILERLRIEDDGLALPEGEIGPMDRSLIVTGGEKGLAVKEAQWGFPAKGGLVINARVETALTKPLFSSSVMYRRCVVPAIRFWEWDANKNRVAFDDPASEFMLLAGFWNMVYESLRFVVLTTEANASVRAVHGRMPLILGEDEARGWIEDLSEAQRLMKKDMPPLNRVAPFEQLSIF